MAADGALEIFPQIQALVLDKLQVVIWRLSPIIIYRIFSLLRFARFKSHVIDKKKLLVFCISLAFIVIDEMRISSRNLNFNMGWCHHHHHHFGWVKDAIAAGCFLWNRSPVDFYELRRACHTRLQIDSLNQHFLSASSVTDSSMYKKLTMLLKLLFHHNFQVSYKWLSRNFSVSSNYAKRCNLRFKWINRGRKILSYTFLTLWDCCV